MKFILLFLAVASLAGCSESPDPGPAMEDGVTYSKGRNEYYRGEEVYNPRSRKWEPSSGGDRGN